MGWRSIWETLRRLGNAFVCGVAWAGRRFGGGEGCAEPSQGWGVGNLAKV
jgi:hypothetical protein